MGLSGCVNVPKELVQFSIMSFDVDPSIINTGESTNLSWVVIAATSVTIDNGIGNVPLTGHRTIMPTETTTYTLTASNATTNKHVTVEVIVRTSNEGGDGTTPTVSLIPDGNDQNTTITLGSVSSSGVLWSDVTFTLVNKSAATQFIPTTFGTASAWGGSTITVANPSSQPYLAGGQLITIKGATVGLTKGSAYTLTLQYRPTGGTLGTASWTQ
jgi:P pilus assembly chaperone PapD